MNEALCESVARVLAVSTGHVAPRVTIAPNFDREALNRALDDFSAPTSGVVDPREYAVRSARLLLDEGKGAAPADQKYCQDFRAAHDPATVRFADAVAAHFRRILREERIRELNKIADPDLSAAGLSQSDASTFNLATDPLTAVDNAPKLVGLQARYGATAIQLLVDAKRAWLTAGPRIAQLQAENEADLTPGEAEQALAKKRNEKARLETERLTADRARAAEIEQQKLKLEEEEKQIRRRMATAGPRRYEY